jgi:transmembrane sensor
MAAISEELLDKFLKGLCTEEEAAAVENYFLEHPEDTSLLDEYEAAGAEAPLPEGYSGEMLEAIQKETVKKDSGRIRTIRVWVAAASVILLIVAGWWLPGRWKKSDSIGGPEGTAIWIGRHNADDRKIRMLLPDSSEVTLSPGAMIRYRKDFGRYDKREVKVEGQVAFAVVKNTHMPFIVYSEMVSTTVLGTVFEVTAEKGDNQIRVRLLAGKVMVGIDPVHDTDRHYMLAPGEEFVFAKGERSVVIREFNHHSGGYAAHRMNRLPGGKPDSLYNWYMFNNQTLADVFDQLSVLYNVDIQYSREDLHNRYFIGKLEMKDSLSKIMRDIALLNHLSVTNTDGRYVVKKRK